MTEEKETAGVIQTSEGENGGYEEPATRRGVNGNSARKICFVSGENLGEEAPILLQAEEKLEPVARTTGRPPLRPSKKRVDEPRRDARRRIISRLEIEKARRKKKIKTRSVAWGGKSSYGDTQG